MEHSQSYSNIHCHTGERLRDKLSFSQYMLLFWGSLLSPMAESLLPLTGKTAFLAPLLFLPFLLLWGALMKDFLQDKQGNIMGFAEKIATFSPSQEKLGLWSKLILLLYLLWGIVLLSYQLRLCATSFLSVGYQEGSLYFILPALAVFVLWLSSGSLGGFARASTFYFAILLLVLFGVLGFSIPMAQWTRVYPLTVTDFYSLKDCFFPIFSLFAYGIYGTFLWGQVVLEGNTVNDKSQQGKSSALWKKYCTWSILGAIICAVFVLVPTAVFGTELMGKLDKPFFVLAKSISLEGGFQRVESIVLSLWTLGDFILLGVLLRASTQCGKKLARWQHDPLIMTAIVATALVFALCIPELHNPWLIHWGNFLLAWLFPCVLFLLKGKK